MGKTIQAYGFSYRVPADVVQAFFERFTGQGTVVAVEVKTPSKGPRSYAIIQFNNEKSAELIINLASTRLYFGSSYLKVREADDLIRAPRTNLLEVKNVTLNFGCQISSNKFAVLWSTLNISVNFHVGLKRINFFLSYDSEEYMLQLSHESIWQTTLYHPHGKSKKFVIQLFGAPRISKKLKDPYSYYLEIDDDQWVRTTDFTPFSCIGQSSGMCLEFPYGIELPHLKGNFVYFKETENELYLEKFLPFSQNLSLVPIIQSPRELGLPYKILFKICSLVQTGCLPWPKLDTNFFRLVSPLIIDITYIEHALETLYYLKECCYDPVSWLRNQYEKYRSGKERSSSPRICLDDGLAYVHRVQVTPTRVYFSGPEVNVTNRVLRHNIDHIDNFLRVSFVDEEWDKLYSNVLYSKMRTFGERRTNVYQRILSILKEGITIGDKKFDFLAFSSSQLRESSLWMFAPTNDLNAACIRSWMGDFSTIRNVAKCAARLGQSFGSSTETLTVNEWDVQNIPDIEIKTDSKKYAFSDGIGKISSDFAYRVAVKCGIKDSMPSAFQIRYAGYKGVVAVDPLSYMKLSLRPSMKKYQSENCKLDVLAWSKYQPCFLNRQIITLLSTLGVKDSVFETKQREAVTELDAILVDPLKAQEALDLMSPGENTRILKELLNCGYMPDEEPFLSMMLRAFRSKKLFDLRTKARIFLRKSQQMMGCLDEYRILEYGQVFVQISGDRQRQFFDESYKQSKDNHIVKGKIAVAKNPCLHPGDVRVLEAIDVPELHHFVDCIVFPQKGNRPHPNECSGSDLDGDIYFVCWDSDLIPIIQDTPMDYDPAPPVELDHVVTIEEIEEYFTNYIVNDSLGIISNAQTAFADKSEAKARSPACLELAKLFSIAVDFPKTGIPAEIPTHLRVKEYPDFMEKPDKNPYKSFTVLGKLFREVKDIEPQGATFKTFTKEVAIKSYDPDMEVDGFQDYLEEAFGCKTEYDYKLGNLMEYYGIKTEAELLSGAVTKMSKHFDQRKDAEAVGAAVKSLRKEAKSWFKIGVESEDQYAKASAWYHVTYHLDYWGCYNEGMNRDHYISFPWCVHDKLIKIKKDKVRSRRFDSLRVGFGNMRMR